MDRYLRSVGLEPSLAVEHACSKSRGRRRHRSLGRGDKDGSDAMDVDVDQSNKRLGYLDFNQDRSHGLLLRLDDTHTHKLIIKKSSISICFIRLFYTYIESSLYQQMYSFATKRKYFQEIE